MLESTCPFQGRKAGNGCTFATPGIRTARQLRLSQPRRRRSSAIRPQSRQGRRDRRQRRNSFQSKATHGLDCNTRRCDKGLRQQDRAPELTAETFDASGQVDRGPYYREVEPVFAPDIAVDHIANMKGDAVGDNRLVSLCTLGIQLIDACDGSTRRGKRLVTGGRRILTADRKDCQQRVTDELQYFPLVLLDGAAHHAEI